MKRNLHYRPPAGLPGVGASARANPSPLGLTGLLALAIALTNGCSPAAPSAAGLGAKAAPVPVTVGNATIQDVPVQLSGIGRVRPYSTVSVRTQIHGELSRVAFKEGDVVKAGDLIFLIDPRPFNAALDQSRANLTRDQALLAKADADFRRSVELRANGVMSESDFDQNRANLDSLKATIVADQATITNAEVQLDFCTIRSPVNGRVGTLLVNQGNIVKDLDTILVTINQFQPIYVDFAVPEQRLPELRENMAKGRLKVHASIPEHPELGADGELLLLNNEVDPTTGTIFLRSQFPNTDELLWPGQFINVTLTLKTQPHAVVVPADAVQLNQDGAYVCVVKPDQTVDFRQIQVGESVGQLVVVRSGLEGREQLVTSGQLRLFPGAKIQIKASAAPPPTAEAHAG